MIKVPTETPRRVSVTIKNKDIILMSDKEMYDGEYTITPHTEDVVVLQTKNKTMKDDVTVFKIPRWDVANQFGKTVYIGEENINGI